MKRSGKPRKPARPGGPSPARLGIYAALAVLAAGAGFLSGGLLQDPNRQAGPPAAERAAAEAASPHGRFILLPKPQAVPDLAFTGADGASRRLSEWRGKAVLLNLWATWCAPCKAEMPSLDRLQAKLGGDKFAVLAISVDRTGLEKPQSFFASNGISHLAVYNDAQAEATAVLRASGLPLSVILDAQGREVARLIGPANWDSPDMAAQIEEFIGRHGRSG